MPNTDPVSTISNVMSRDYNTTFMHQAVVKTFGNKTPLIVQSQSTSPSFNSSDAKFHLNESGLNYWIKMKSNAIFKCFLFKSMS